MGMLSGFFNWCRGVKKVEEIKAPHPEVVEDWVPPRPISGPLDIEEARERFKKIERFTPKQIQPKKVARVYNRYHEHHHSDDQREDSDGMLEGALMGVATGMMISELFDNDSPSTHSDPSPDFGGGLFDGGGASGSWDSSDSSSSSDSFSSSDFGSSDSGSSFGD